MRRNAARMRVEQAARTAAVGRKTRKRWVRSRLYLNHDQISQQMKFKYHVNNFVIHLQQSHTSKKVIFLSSTLLFTLHLLLKAEPTHRTYKPAHSFYITILCQMMFLHSHPVHDLSADKQPVHYFEYLHDSSGNHICKINQQ